MLKQNNQTVFEAVKKMESEASEDQPLMRWATVKRTDFATKEKRYTPLVAGKRLRISWTTRTKAEKYAQRALNKYLMLLRAHKEYKKGLEK